MTTPRQQGGLNSQLSQGVASSAQMDQNLVSLGGTLRALAIPALALGGAMAFFSGQTNNAQVGIEGLTVSEAQLAAQTFALEARLRALKNEALEDLVPVLEDVIDWMDRADKATDGWSTRIGAAAIGLAGLAAAARLAGIPAGISAGARGTAAVGRGLAAGVGIGAGAGAAGTLGAAGLVAGAYTGAYSLAENFVQGQGGQIYGGSPIVGPYVPPEVLDYLERQIASALGIPTAQQRALNQVDAARAAGAYVPPALSTSPTGVGGTPTLEDFLRNRPQPQSVQPTGAFEQLSPDLLRSLANQRSGPATVNYNPTFNINARASAADIRKIIIDDAQQGLHSVRAGVN